MKNDCLFCKIVAKEIPSSIIEENDEVMVIKDIAPKAPIHYLVIPKKHVQDIQSLTSEDEQLAGKLMMMANKIAQQLPGTGDFRLVVNSGKQAGQQVFHLHAHMLAGKKMEF